MNFNILYRETYSDMPRSRCDNYYCTTCGGQASKIRDRLKSVTPEKIIEFLLSLHYKDFRRCGYHDKWRLYIRHLLLGPEFGGYYPRICDTKISEILVAWESKLADDEKMDYCDFVMYYFLRYLPNTAEIKLQWRDKCLDYISQHENRALIETLLLTFKKDCPNEIIKKAMDIAIHDHQMKRVITNTL